MELAGGPRLDEEGGGYLVGTEAQTTWWTPFLSRQLLHLQHHAKAVKPQRNRHTDGRKCHVSQKAQGTTRILCPLAHLCSVGQRRGWSQNDMSI